MADGAVPDPTSLGFVAMISAWAGDQSGSSLVFGVIAQASWPDALRRASHGVLWPDRPQLTAHVVPRLHKLAQLVAVLASHAPSDPESVLQAVEGFVVAGQRWLKVAGGAKAHVIAAAMAQHTLVKGSACVELGCFVGYTATRLGACFEVGPTLAPPNVVSCEFEAIHVCVARFTLSLAKLGRVEVWAGHVPYVTPRISEQLGGYASCFEFMDHKGTRFHEDRRHFDALSLHAPRACTLCDNIIHPGAPEYLWAECRRPQHRCYALPEFAQVLDVEDWQSILDDPGLSAQ